jgi:hypothetical protein
MIRIELGRGSKGFGGLFFVDFCLKMSVPWEVDLGEDWLDQRGVHSKNGS